MKTLTIFGVIDFFLQLATLPREKQQHFTFGISSPSCKTALLANFQLDDISIKPAEANTNRQGCM